MTCDQVTHYLTKVNLHDLEQPGILEKYKDVEQLLSNLDNLENDALRKTIINNGGGKTDN
jgi:hypothetical protein